MALTREYKKTVVARIQRDEKFARALYAEALNARLEGETAEGLSMLRDLVHAQISFKELARQTGLGEKTLHRMLSRRGNPTTRNLVAIESYGTRHRSAFEFCFRNQPSVAIVVSQDGGIKTVTRVGKHIYFWENIFFDASTEI
jgi:DNA-binding phage protein